MEHNTHREKWIDDILGSMQGMQRAMPDDGLYDRVKNRLSRPERSAARVPYIRWAAAAVFIIGLNIASVVYFNKEDRHMATNTENPIASQLQTQTIYNY